MRPLKSIENEAGEVTRLVSDAEFADMIISVTGHMLSLTTPPGLFEQHAYEREVLAALQQKLALEAETERQRALSEKLAESLQLAYSDPRAAAHKMLEDIADKAMTLPRRLKPISNSRRLAAKSKGVVIQGLSSLLR